MSQVVGVMADKSKHINPSHTQPLPGGRVSGPLPPAPAATHRFELWDLDTGNVIAEFDTELDALRYIALAALDGYPIDALGICDSDELWADGMDWPED